MLDSSFFIVGGGIAGIGAALGLARLGKSSRVFERATAFQEVGAGLQLGPNAVRALERLGAWDAVKPYCFEPREIHVRDGHSGTLLQRVGLGAAFEKRFRAPYRVVHRAGLLQGLLDSAKASSFISLETSSEVTAVWPETAGVLVNGLSEHATGLIGCDGIHSMVRLAIQGESHKKNQSQTLYRKLLPAADCPGIVDREVVTLWMCDGGHIVCYSVDAGRQLNIVVSVEEMETAATPRLAGLCDEASAVAHSRGSWLPWAGYDIEPDPQWYSGSTVIMGDAAHATLPYLAQGAAMSLEDGCVLSDCLNTGAATPQAFQDFARRRYPRTAQLQLQSRRQGQIYHMAGLTRHARNLAIKAMPEQSFLGRLSWLYDWYPED